jgi:glutamate racemase
MKHRNKIGVIDSGIGGFTVVKELRELLPNEGIIYYGDNLNCPYGNRSKEEILRLTLDMLDFLNEKKVKVVGIACNTISTLIAGYKDRYDFPILDIITPTADYVIDSKKDDIGIIGTTFTIESGSYQKKLLSGNGNIKIVGEPSPDLAMLIDSGDFDSPVIKDVIKNHLNNITEGNEVAHLILACTHYPIVEDIFKLEAPNLEIINPGYHLAEKIKMTLKDNNMVEEDNNMETPIEIFTSGNVEIYYNTIEKLKIKDKFCVSSISI